jgi:mannose-1-phosphate guanylyltransferase
MTTTSNTYGIVLAGGDGRRMAILTRALFGRWIPKQFAAIGGERTLLQRTMDRSGRLIPAERTLVVVSRLFGELAAQQLAGYPGVEIVEQPDNRGTAPGLLLPLRRVLARDPQAEVVIAPSDHHVTRPAVLTGAVERALEAARRADAGVALVGARPDDDGRDLGWVLPGMPVAGVPAAYEVRQFVEKPPRAVADRLRAVGGLWNTFLLAGSARALWQLCKRHLPAHVAGFENSSAGLPELYRKLRPADFSREVMEKAAGVAVVEMAGAGWHDWGTPETVLESLRGTAGFAGLLERVLELADPAERHHLRRRFLTNFGSTRTGNVVIN